jgi:transposase
MKPIDYTIAIAESESELLDLERRQTVSRFRDYVRFIRYLKTAQAKSQQASGALIGLQLRQSQNLWQGYQKKGLAKLLKEYRGGSVGHLSYCQISQLQSFLRDSQVALTQQQVADWIKSNFVIEYTQGGISDLFKRLKINGAARAAENRPSCKCSTKSSRHRGL